MDKGNAERASTVAGELPAGRSFGVEEADQLLQPDYRGGDPVAILSVERLVRVATRCQNYYAAMQDDLPRLLLQIDTPAIHRLDALPAFRAEVPVDRRDRRVAAGIREENGLALGETVIETVGGLFRTGRDSVLAVD